MGIYETGVRGAWRQLMRVAERRIAGAGELGTPLAAKVGVEQRPVLLVHGYGNTSASMQAIHRSLERDGFRPFSIDLPSHGYDGIDAGVRAVDEAVERIRRVTGSVSVDVVGHSLGGVIARTWQQRFGTPGSGARVVTVSSANQGLHLGAVDRLLAGALPDGMQQIRRGASIVDDLARNQRGHDTVAVGTTGMDGVLVPASAARIDGVPFVAVDDGRTLGPLSRVGHYGILRDDAAYDGIRGALLLPR